MAGIPSDMAMHKMKYEIVCQCNSDGINKFRAEGKWVESAKCQRTIFACLAFVCEPVGGSGWVEMEVEL